MPRNLLAIVALQALTLAAARVVERRLPGARGSAAVAWPLAACIGALFGAMMDLVLGAAGVFAYLPAGAGTVPVEPRRLPVAVLALNAVASYGLAAVTVAPLATAIVGRGRLAPAWTWWLAAGALVGAVGASALPRAGVPLLFAWGVLIVSGAELALARRDRIGPVAALAARRDPRPLAVLVACSAAVGACYEAANVAFPFWAWLPGSTWFAGSDSRRILLAALVAMFGYVVLFHPIVSLMCLLAPQQKDGGR
ncbi:MAG TPA: hypothetical protein VMU33_07015 [Burkholderiaceae bacterium]|nr:hypothetical protein [Burkholderiaceae bacterium]